MTDNVQELKKILKDLHKKLDATDDEGEQQDLKFEIAEREFQFEELMQQANRIAEAQKFLRKIAGDLEKFQFTPSTVCIEPNDAFTKDLFIYGPNGFKNALNGREFTTKIKSKIRTGKGKAKPAVYAAAAISNAEGYDNENPLTEFDRAVLGVCISEYLTGNRFTTINAIYRALIGKVGKGRQGFYPRPDQLKAIEESVKKLMGTVVDFRKVASAYEDAGITTKDGGKVTMRLDNLLPATVIDAEVNGQVLEGVVYFSHMPQLYEAANLRNQIIRYRHELMDVPNQRNTPRIIAMKKYVMRRICEIKLHRNLPPTITFDDVFKRLKLKFENLKNPRSAKLDLRNALVKFFEHLQKEKFVQSFEIFKTPEGEFVSVKFTF